MPIETLKSDFVCQFGDGGRIHIIRAPGRVNLIGEHTDYNDGFVFPMAIDPQVLFVCRARSDSQVNVRSSLFPGADVTINLRQAVDRAEPKWSDYVRGPIAMLLEKGVPLVGMDCLIVNTLPMGGGLSSSAAMEVGTASAMLRLAGQEMDPQNLARLCQQAEHRYANVPCGIMDQMIVTCARPGHAMLLDCRDFSQRFVPVESAELSVVIVNSMVRHELSGGEYAQRRSQCEQGVAYFHEHRPQVRALRDVVMSEVEEARERLGDLVFRRCRHVVGENERCTQFATHLQKQEYEIAGRLMVESHDSLRDDYEVSVPELDYLVEQAMQLRGVYGSRMTGGGFGGSTVSLVTPRHTEAFISEITRLYKERYHVEPVAFATAAAAGVSAIA